MRICTLLIAIALLLYTSYVVDAKLALKPSATIRPKPKNRKNALAKIQKSTLLQSPHISVVALDKGVQKIDLRGPLSILGGALVHLCLGTLYCWGNFLSYTPQYLKFFDGKLHPGVQPDALYVIPMSVMFQAMALPFGPSLVKKFGTRKTMLFGAWMTSLATVLASYQTRLAPFMLFYSAMFGTGCGLAYVAPMMAGWSYLPNSKGIVSGGILAGFGGGGFIFSLIGSSIANPNGANAVNGVFPEEVYNNFPKMLRTLGVMYAVVSLLGSLLVSELKPVESLKFGSDVSKSQASPIVPGLSVGQALRSQQFWLMWLMVVACSTSGLNTASIYKQFAATSPALSGDAYQAMVGGIGAIFNGSGRIFWGGLSDRIGFKKSFILLTVLQIISLLSYNYAAASKLAFAANTCSLFFCLAGNLALMPPVVQKVFGPRAGATIYGLLYSAFAFASILGGLMTKGLAKSYGWPALFAALGGMTFVAALLTQGVKPVDGYAESTV